MPRASISRILSSNDKRKLLRVLEQLGADNLNNYMTQKLLYVLSSSDMRDREFMARYLLLAATLDQQADSESAKETVVKIYTKYGTDFFLNPSKYTRNLYNIIEFVKPVYKPRTRVLRMKKETVLLSRIGGFLLTLDNIQNTYGGLISYFSLATSPRNLLDLILTDPLLSGLLYEKAARMYTGWISHPNLWISISSGRWAPCDIPMAVNGHVCKVLSRAGFLSQVLVEDTQRYIVKAEDERDNIEREVSRVYPEGDRVMIDFGAFYVGINYCGEEVPYCSKCPINMLCLKNVQFRAY